jgi:hypothetical protein
VVSQGGESWDEGTSWRTYVKPFLGVGSSLCHFDRCFEVNVLVRVGEAVCG